MSDHDARTLLLASVYAEACRDVQPTWLAILATPVCNHSSVNTCGCPRRLAMKAYFNAGLAAQNARKELLEHISGGLMEVGV
jgi:hypothetical protein